MMEVIHRGWLCGGPAPPSWIQVAAEANLEGRRRGGGGGDAQRLGYPDAQRPIYIVYIHGL